MFYYKRKEYRVSLSEYGYKLNLSLHPTLLLQMKLETKRNTRYIIEGTNRAVAECGKSDNGGGLCDNINSNGLHCSLLCKEFSYRPSTDYCLVLDYFLVEQLTSY